jgi:hypothetical protein
MPKTVHPIKSSKNPSKKRHKNLPSKIVKKKPYVELVTAFLSIPVLITVLLLNVTSLRNINARPTPTPEPEKVYNGNGFFAAPVRPSRAVSPSTTVDPSPCKKALGPVSISSPGENDTVTDNPVTINIEYGSDSVYCGAAWSYRINGGSWSGYDDRSVALYNLPRGQVTFDLRVRSIVTSDEKSLTRNFLYDPKEPAVIPENPNSSGSAN